MVVNPYKELFKNLKSQQHSEEEKAQILEKILKLMKYSRLSNEDWARI